MSDIAGKKPDGVIGYTDTADKGSDFLNSLSSQRFGDYTYVTDVVFTQDGVEVTEPLVARMIIDTKCKLMTVESNNGGSSFAKNVQKIIRDISTQLKKSHKDAHRQKAAELDGYFVYDEPATTNKETRILMSAGYVKQYFYFRDDYEPGSDYDKFMRQLTGYVKIGKNKHDDAADGVTGLAEYMQNNFYVRPNKEVIEGNKFYLESELDDMVAAKKITRHQMKEYLKKGVRSW
jgi:predicted phage terminase large subunit-like protein